MSHKIVYLLTDHGVDGRGTPRVAFASFDKQTRDANKSPYTIDSKHLVNIDQVADDALNSMTAIEKLVYFNSGELEGDQVGYTVLDHEGSPWISFFSESAAKEHVSNQEPNDKLSIQPEIVEIEKVKKAISQKLGVLNKATLDHRSTYSDFDTKYNPYLHF